MSAEIDSDSDDEQPTYRPKAPAPPPPPPPEAATSAPLPATTAAGTIVFIRGLKARPELNGRRATIDSFSEESGRFSVRLDAGDVLSLKPESIQIVSDAAPMEVVEAAPAAASSAISVSDPDPRPSSSSALTKVSDAIDGGDRTLKPMSHGHSLNLTLHDKAVSQLTPWLKHIDEFKDERALEEIRRYGKELYPSNIQKRADKIAKALSVQHCNWTDAVDGMAQWARDDWMNFSARMQECKLSVGDVTKLKRKLSAHDEACKAPTTNCVATVSSGEVMLKLTLTPKFMVRPLRDAVLNPFLKVWSKKFRIEPAKTDRDVIRVEVDGKHVEDYGVLCDTILRKEEVSVSVMLKPVGYDDD